MTSSEAYRKLNAQADLAERQVQPLLEQLIAELTVSRPADPISALIARLEEIESAVASGEGSALDGPGALRFCPPRHMLSVLGCPGSGKTTQATLAAATSRESLLLSVESLTDEAVRGGVSRKGYEDVSIPQDLQLAVLDAAQQGVPINTPTLIALTRNRVALAEQALATTTTAATSGSGNRMLIVLDGYPRTMEEALALEKELGEISHIVQLGCTPEAGSHRARAAGSSDEALEAQWAVFEKQTVPLVEYWRAKKKFTMVDGDADKLVCAKSIKALLHQM